MTFSLKKDASVIAGPRYTPWLFAGMMLFLGLGITAELWRHIRLDDADKLQIEFESSADMTANIISGRLHGYGMVMRGVKGFYEGSARVSPKEFAAFVRALELDHHTGVQGIGMVKIVPHPEKERHIAEMRRNGDSNYDIKPHGVRPGYAPIIYMEPMNAENMKVIGFDTLTVPVARRAMERARDRDELTITSRLTLIQDSDKEKVHGFVMYLPIYRRGANLDTVTARREAIEAWVDVPFRMRDLLAGMHGLFDPDIRLEVHDGEPRQDQTLMYRPDVKSGVTGSACGKLKTRRQLRIGGRQWTLLMCTTPVFEARVSNRRRSMMTATIGVVLTLTLSSLAWLLARGRTVALVRYRKLFEQAGDGVLLTSRDYRFVDANAAVLKLLGYRREELMKLRLFDVLAEHEWSRVEPVAAEIMAGKPHLQEWMHRRKDGVEFPTEVNLRWLDSDCYLAIVRDLSERKKAEQQLYLSAKVFESSREGIVITDADNVIVSVNPAYTEISGYTAEEAIGKTPRLVSSGKHGKAFYRGMWKDIRNRGYWQGEVINRRKNGDLYPQWISINVIRDRTGQITHHVGIMSDLSDFKAAEEQIQFLSNFDSLTHLPNRSLLRDRTLLALAAARRSHRQVVMMYIDLDRFKIINDSLGPDAGDRLLKELSRRLVKHLHPDDTLSRQGGDELMLLLPDTNAEGAAHVAQKILTLIARPFVIDGRHLTLTASIGIAEYPQDGDTFDQLAQSADAAMFRAKERGRNNFQFYTRQLHEKARHVLEIENDLRQALHRGELVLYYQPQVDAKTLEIIGAEALIRWSHPRKGMVSPGQFIPVAEESGLIVDIGEWVLHEAVSQAVAWQAAGLRIVPVAVNISVAQFRQDALYQKVVHALDEHKLEPTLLELEITEGVAMENSERTTGMLDNLNALGVKLSIDDFGTGYSSLSYLKRYKIDKLKIDQSFIRDLGSDSEDDGIVTAIIGMAKSLGFKTIAEGVETREQLDFLKRKDCDEIQGYLFSKPVPAETFAELLRQGKIRSIDEKDVVF